MDFQLGDEVVYDGSLGKHVGTVAAVSPEGAVDVAVSGLPDRLRTDVGSLTARAEAGLEHIQDTYAEVGPLPAGTTPGEASAGWTPPNYDQGAWIPPGSTTATAPVAAAAQPVEPMSAGNDVTAPPTAP